MESEKPEDVPQKFVNLCKRYAHGYAHADVQMLCVLAPAVCSGREVHIGGIMWSGATEEEVRDVARMIRCKQFSDADTRKMPFPLVKEK
jgi:hypothetical protein